MRLVLFILASFLLTFLSCKSKEDTASNPFANSIAKTTTNDSISIIGEWRLTARNWESQYFFINQGMLVKFKFNHILEISPSEFYIWQLDDNVLKVYSPLNVQHKSFYDSMYIQIKNDDGYYDMTLTDIVSNNQMSLSRHY